MNICFIKPAISLTTFDLQVCTHRAIRTGMITRQASKRRVVGALIKNSILGIFLISAPLIITGCGGGESANSAAPTLVSISLTPTDSSVRFALNQQLTANGNYSDGSIQDLTSSVVWSASDPDIASISTGAPTPGLATGVHIGSTTVNATLGTTTGSTTLAVIGTISLPKTGQVSCYDPGGATTTIPCSGTGQDGDMPNGVALPNPRFSAATGAAADCVTDNLTGLMWTRDANLTNIGGANGGKRTWQKALDYANDLNTSQYCGFADWRLPNITELATLVDNEVTNQADNLNTLGFINVQGSGANDASGYWSSTTLARSTDSAWGVDMHAGCTGSCHVKTDAANYVWPVRGGR